MPYPLSRPRRVIKLQGDAAGTTEVLGLAAAGAWAHFATHGSFAGPDVQSVLQSDSKSDESSQTREPCSDFLLGTPWSYRDLWWAVEAVDPRSRNQDRGRPGYPHGGVNCRPALARAGSGRALRL